MAQHIANRIRDREGEALPDITDGSQAGMSPNDWDAIWARCWRRIRSWRVPPGWSTQDWREEARAEGSVAAWQAARDYDLARGVPRVAFVYQRVLAGVWTRYRQEWGYRRHHRSPLPVEDRPTPADPTTTAGDSGEVAWLLGQLGEADRWLIQQLFWADTTEAAVARVLGISQQAVSLRKYHALKSLKRVTELFS